MLTFRPMLAASVKQLDLLQLPLIGSYKIDGIRCLITELGPVTRTLKPIPNRFILSQLQNLPIGLDGELTATGTFRDTASAIMSHDGEPSFTYHVFDDFTTPTTPYYKRLELAISKCEPPAVALDQFQLDSTESILTLYDQALSLGYEGLILRNAYAPYKYGRSTLNQQWMLKLKPWKDTEATVTGIEEEQQNNNMATVNTLGLQERSSHQENKTAKGRMGALIVYTPEHGTFSVGTGFTEDERIKLWNSPPLKRVIKFKYLTIGNYDLPRHPVFLGFVDEIS